MIYYSISSTTVHENNSAESRSVTDDPRRSCSLSLARASRRRNRKKLSANYTTRQARLVFTDKHLNRAFSFSSILCLQQHVLPSFVLISSRVNHGCDYTCSICCALAKQCFATIARPTTIYTRDVCSPSIIACLYASKSSISRGQHCDFINKSCALSCAAYWNKKKRTRIRNGGWRGNQHPCGRQVSGQK